MRAHLLRYRHWFLSAFCLVSILSYLLAGCGKTTAPATPATQQVSAEKVMKYVYPLPVSEEDAALEVSVVIEEDGGSIRLVQFAKSDLTGGVQVILSRDSLRGKFSVDGKVVGLFPWVDTKSEIKITFEVHNDHGHIILSVGKHRFERLTTNGRGGFWGYEIGNGAIVKKINTVAVTDHH